MDIQKKRCKDLIIFFFLVDNVFMVLYQEVT